MPNAKEFLSILETDYHNFEKYFKSFLNNYSRITNFLERTFSMIPLELIAIFFMAILIFYILNSISKDTSKINFVISVILSTVILYFVLKVGILNKKKLADSLNRVLISPVILISIVFIYYFLILGFKKIISNFSKNKIINTTSFEKSILNLQSSYNELMKEYYLLPEKNYSYTDLEYKLHDLQILTETVVQNIQVQSNNSKSVDKKIYTSEPLNESSVVTSHP